MEGLEPSGPVEDYGFLDRCATNYALHFRMEPIRGVEPRTDEYKTPVFPLNYIGLLTLLTQKLLLLREVKSNKSMVVYMAQNQGVDIIYSPRWFSPTPFSATPIPRGWGWGLPVHQYQPSRADQGLNPTTTSSRRSNVYIQ